MPSRGAAVASFRVREFSHLRGFVCSKDEHKQHIFARSFRIARITALCFLSTALSLSLSVSHSAVKVVLKPAERREECSAVRDFRASPGTRGAGRQSSKHVAEPNPPSGQFRSPRPGAGGAKNKNKALDD